jgi:hypothetical protein
MFDTFDPTREPLRAIRDLISAVEVMSLVDREDEVILRRAQEAFGVLRKLFGDERPAEEIAYGPMIEPHNLLGE